ncbi:class I SAM-dependent methyltransferase [Sansalvadorimonas verongulae]|uniref:class I SAM-dependent methyltransferase n=1 Tax=Sansalvadorimonas verongulae TaxID=2172824 RepID=UPI0012BC90E8|nr:methyltransferase domain-containing protein [Sansalvadorimonas verongulae]MTI12861.1 methyltransferase domain-containing protein [Sansalvadorimonas verongulae]
MVQPKPISFSEAERLSLIFDSETREEWQRTSHIMKTLDLKPDMVIADVGAGTGYFSSQFSDLLPEGKVYALDTEANMISYMNNRFAEEKRTNVETRQSEFTNPCLPEGLDVVFLANVYRFIKERDVFLGHMFDQVSHATQVVFVDFRGSNARVTPQQAVNEVTAAGFEVEDMDMTGCPDHYILRFCKPQAV